MSRNVKVKTYKIILFVSYGCETWSLTLREEYRLRVLRRISGPKRDEVTGERKNLHNEELHNFYSSPNVTGQNKSKRMRWVGHVTHMGQERKVYRVLVRKPERHSEDQSVDGRMGSHWILQIGGGRGGMDGSSCLRIRTRGDEPSGSGATELFPNNL
jgi:hypothetical protein